MKPSLRSTIAPLCSESSRRGMKGYATGVLLGLAGIAFFGFIIANNDYKTRRIAAEIQIYRGMRFANVSRQYPIDSFVPISKEWRDYQRRQTD